MRGRKVGRKEKRELGREMLFIFRFHFYSLIPGKHGARGSPLQFDSPATSLNCEIHKPRVQSRGAGRARRTRRRARMRN